MKLDAAPAGTCFDTPTTSPTTTSTTTTTPTTTRPDFDCEAAGGDGFYEYAKNCIKYVQCYQGVPQIHTCNPGMYFLKFIVKNAI